MSETFEVPDLLLTIQHEDVVFSPPVKSGVKIERERTGSPSKLTFTTVKIPNAGMSFSEGDPVCFYYKNQPVFMGYVFTKKRDREHHIEVTCYDQIRYLKNKYTYVFTNKSATEITKALCNDFNLYTGDMDDTQYVIPSLVEENKSAIDIITGILEDTLVNTKQMYTLYDDFGKICLKNCRNMVSTTLIMKDTAENFDYSSSIDGETYNSIVLYYKEDDNKISVYTASSPNRINQWGTLRYFEEVKNKTIAQNKARALLSLYNHKTRELKITGAFGDIEVRGGTLIPVKLDLGDIETSNFMLVTKVVHNFEKDHYTMDLTLEGAWPDHNYGDTVTSSYVEEFDLPIFATSDTSFEESTHTGSGTGGGGTSSGGGGGRGGSPSGGSGDRTPYAAPNKIIATAKSQIGTTESPSGSNNVKYNEAYGQNGIPWCCTFVWWVFREAGYSNLFFGGGRTASCTTLMNYYKNQGKTSSTPHVGSLVFFQFDSDSYADHIGIITAVNNDGTITTIEGNTGNGNDTNGGAVMRRTRSTSIVMTYAYPY